MEDYVRLLSTTAYYIKAKERLWTMRTLKWDPWFDVESKDKQKESQLQEAKMSNKINQKEQEQQVRPVIHNNVDHQEDTNK